MLLGVQVPELPEAVPHAEQHWPCSPVLRWAPASLLLSHCGRQGRCSTVPQWLQKEAVARAVL